MVFLSHLHWDHCYNLDQFVEAGVPIRVSRTELKYAVAPDPCLAYAYEATSLGRQPSWMGLDLTPVSGEIELAPGVTAFPTPGHAVGHYSLAVDTAEGTTVVAVDAIDTFENLRGTDELEFLPGAAIDDRAWWRSATEIVDRADEVLPGHSGGFFDMERPDDAV